MGLYLHTDKKPGDGLALTEWNTLSSALAGASSLTLALNNEKVGIGTTASSAKLEVNGTIKVSGSETEREIFFSDNGQIRSADNNHRILFRRTENILELRENGKIMFSAGAANGQETASMVIAASGNVGIGIAAPTSKLHVSGDTNLAGGLRVANAVAIGSDRLVVQTNGNVGIGKSDPSAKLEVNGTIKVSGSEIMFTDNGQIRSYDNNHRILFRRTENIMELRECGKIMFSAGSGTGMETASMVIDSSGKVGIGISAPTQKLDVSGNVKAEKFIGDGSMLTGLSLGLTGLNMATTSGNVGIGTSAPQKKLHVNGHIMIEGKNTLEFGGNVSGKEKSAGLMGYEFFTVGALDIVGAGPAYNERKVKIWSEGGLEVTGDIKTTGLEVTGDIKTTGLEATGNIKTTGLEATGNIKTTGLEVTKNINMISGVGQEFNEFSMSLINSPTHGKGIAFNLKNSMVGMDRSIIWNGDNNWDQLSDGALKTNIVREEGILNRLMNLNVVNYNWRDRPDAQRKPIGFIAQNVKAWFPNLVGEITDTETKETNLTLGYTGFGVLAVGAIQELKMEHDAKIAALELEIARLKDKIPGA